MKASTDMARAPAWWWVLGWICGLVVSPATAAQTQSPVPLGALLTVTSADFGDINNLNAPLGNRPKVLHFNTAVYTLSFSQPNQIRLPRRSLGSIASINYDTSIVDQTPGDPNVATVAVSPSSQSFVPGSTLFLLYPSGDFNAFQNANPRKSLTAVHNARILVGGNSLPVVLLKLDQADAQGLVPTVLTSTDVLQQLNTNIAVPPPGPAPGMPIAQIVINVLPPFAVNGSASVIPGVGLRLTSSGPYQAGSAWQVTKRQVAGGFRFTFDFVISNPGGIVDSYGQRGADGFAFVIQNYSLSALGGVGGYLGYDGIPDSLAVEFDTWWNPEFGDPNGNHISVHTGGTGPNSILANFSLGDTTAIPNLKDGARHTVKISYQPGALQVFIDNLTTPVLAVPVDLAQILNLDAGTAWVGFTAGTGAAFENHDILSFDFQSL